MMNLLDLKNALTPSPEQLYLAPPHIKAFCAFLVDDFSSSLVQLVKDASKLSEQERTYETTAALGYAVSFGVSSDDLFRDDVARLSGRKFFSPGRPLRLELDGIALLGISLGIRSSNASTLETAWIKEVIRKSKQEVQSDAWQSALLTLSERILGRESLRNIGSTLLTVALATRLHDEVDPKDLQEAWSSIHLIPNDDLPRICTKRAVFDTAASALSALPVREMTVGSLIKLLDGVERSMLRWTFEDKARVRGGLAREWNIDNEYHVQNLLWAILAPVFPDLIDEEYLPAVGHKHPRYDLGIPSIRTIVEVKYLRGAGQSAFAGLIEEVAADVSLYIKSDQGYDGIIAFIWDDNAQTEEHSKLRAGLLKITGIQAVIILSRPHRLRQT